MLNKPKFMSPSINMYGNSVIDLNSETLPFSCIVDGNEAVTDCQIVITRLKDNLIVFDTGMQTLDAPFFPINNRNQNVVFTKDLKNYFLDVKNGETTIKMPLCKNTYKNYDENKKYYYYNAETCSLTDYEHEPTTGTWETVQCDLYYSEFINSTDMYYWTIIFKNSKSDTEARSAPEVFYANSTPQTKIYYSYDNDFTKLPDNVDFTGLQKRKIYFKSTYEQAEGVSLKRYGWRLTDITNDVVIMDTISQNQIYGIADDISCVCNGLINQTEYQIELYVETQNGYFNVLEPVKFDVNYAVKSIGAEFEVLALNDTSGILLNWNQLVTTEGVVVGDSVNYTDKFPLYSSSSVEIPENTSIIFSKTSNDKDLKIDKNSYIVLSFGFDKTQDTTLFEISGVDDYLNVISRRLEYTALDRKLKYTIKGSNSIATYEEQLSPTISELCWYVVTLYPLINDEAYYKLVESIPDECLFPDTDLYPTAENDEELLYPDFGNWNKLRGEVS